MFGFGRRKELGFDEEYFLTVGEFTTQIDVLEMAFKVLVKAGVPSSLALETLARADAIVRSQKKREAKEMGLEPLHASKDYSDLFKGL